MQGKLLNFMHSNISVCLFISYPAICMLWIILSLWFDAILPNFFEFSYVQSLSILEYFSRHIVSNLEFLWIHSFLIVSNHYLLILFKFDCCYFPCFSVSSNACINSWLFCFPKLPLVMAIYIEIFIGKTTSTP